MNTASSSDKTTATKTEVQQPGAGATSSTAAANTNANAQSEWFSLVPLWLAGIDPSTLTTGLFTYDSPGTDAGSRSPPKQAALGDNDNVSHGTCTNGSPPPANIQQEDPAPSWFSASSWWSPCEGTSDSTQQSSSSLPQTCQDTCDCASKGKGTSASSNSTDVPTPHGEVDAPSIPAPEDSPDCPICFSEILPGAAAMRCMGQGGSHHYFHRECLGHWIRTCNNSGQTAPTCPICRGKVQVNVNTLSAFLESQDGKDLPTEERSYLQQLLARARVTLGGSSEEEWVDPFTMEDAMYFGVHGLAATAGFAAAFSDGCTDDLMLMMAGDLASPSMQVVGGIGYIAGITTRIVHCALENS